MSDRGCYLCEVNTEPSSTIYAVFLDVQEPPPPPPAAHKKGTLLMANMAGDEVLLNCTVSVGGEPAADEDDVVWTRDGKAMNLNDTNKYIWKVKRSAGVVVYTVRIRKATMEDDGDYACESRHQRASQIVHVNKAEAQRSSSLSLAMLSTQLTVLMIAGRIL
ncbi:immunoglobulin domain protein [Ostertagia ostertagi]